MIKEIPVYLFTGFLGAGKTTFIQDILEADDFNQGERTLLLACEEGEIEYDPSRFAFSNVFIESIEDEEDLTVEHLISLEKKYDIDRAVIEYNGMWMLDSLFSAMPEGWMIYQEMTFSDATNFLMYNQNMRQLNFDKMKTAELNVFNRCEKGFDKMAFHKEVRIANRKAQIVYEYGPDDVEPDTIEDPLPYDMDAPVIEILPEYFAEWYRDVNENCSNYEGKVIRVKGRVGTSDDIPDDKFIFGRHVMTCCVEDIQFAGLIAVYEDAPSLENGAWVEITAEVREEYEDAYREDGPVLYCRQLKETEPVEPEVATF